MNLRKVKDAVELITQNSWNADSLEEAKNLVLSWDSNKQYAVVRVPYNGTFISINILQLKGKYILRSNLFMHPYTEFATLEGRVGESKAEFDAKVEDLFEQTESSFGLLTENQGNSVNRRNKKTRSNSKASAAKFKRLSKGMPYEVEEEDGVLKVIISGWIDTLPAKPNKWMKEAYDADDAAEELYADRENPSWEIAADALDYVCNQCGATYQEYAFSPESWIFEVNF